MGGEPFAREGARRILRKLAHLAGEGTGDDVERAVFVIRIHAAHIGYVVRRRRERKHVVLPEPFDHDGFRRG